MLPRMTRRDPIRPAPGPGAPPTLRASRAELLGLALVAAAVIASEIVLTRIFSFITWHHYTPLIIGIALLGFGFAGSFLSTRPDGTRRDRSAFLGRLEREALAFALALPLSLLLCGLVRFNPSRIFADWTPLASLLIYLVLVAVPFALAGLVICRLLDRYRTEAGRVYGVDLAASAGGVLLALALITRAGAEATILIAALLAALGALLFSAASGRIRRAPLLGALAIVLALAATLIAPPRIFHPPPSKEMAVFERDPALRAVGFWFSRWNPIARIDVTRDMTGPAPDFGGELAPAARSGAGIEHYRYLFQDGTAPSAFLRIDRPYSEVAIMRSYLQSAPYQIRPQAKALVIGLGGGIDLAIALAHGATAVTGVEVNPVTLGLLRSDLAAYVGGLATDPRVTLVHGEGRAFARQSHATYDVIQLSGADTFAALASGSGSLTEGYLYTVEAVADFLSRLEPSGVLSYSRPYFTPPRETLKLVATAARALRAQGVQDPSAHILVIAGQKWAETLISPSPFSASDVATIETFARDSGFHVLATPTAGLRTPWDRYLALDAAAAASFRRDYFFNVEPATDDRPFFYNYARWATMLSNRKLPLNIGLEGYYTVESPFGPLPIGNVMLAAALVVLALLAGTLIVFPLRSRAAALTREPALTARVLAYFAALGLAFIAVEITLIQHFQLALGGPTLALGAVLFALLGGAGLGSLLGQRLQPAALRWVLPLLALVLVLALVGLPSATRALASMPVAPRVVLAAVLIAVPGVLMGMPFPLGIRAIAGRGQALVPWAWAANGLFSVIGSVASLLVAMAIGFTLVMALAIGIYLIGFAALSPELRSAARSAR